MSIGTSVQTDNRKVQAIVGAKDLSIAPCRSSGSQSSRAEGKRIEKFTSRYHHYFSLPRPPLLAGLVQQEIPAFISAFLRPSMLIREDFSGVPPPSQCVSRLSPKWKPSRCKAFNCPTQSTMPLPTGAQPYLWSGLSCTSLQWQCPMRSFGNRGYPAE